MERISGTVQRNPKGSKVIVLCLGPNEWSVQPSPRYYYTPINNSRWTTHTQRCQEYAAVLVTEYGWPTGITVAQLPPVGGSILAVDVAQPQDAANHPHVTPRTDQFPDYKPIYLNQPIPEQKKLLYRIVLDPNKAISPLEVMKRFDHGNDLDRYNEVVEIEHSSGSGSLSVKTELYLGDYLGDDGSFNFPTGGSPPRLRLEETVETSRRRLRSFAPLGSFKKDFLAANQVPADVFDNFVNPDGSAVSKRLVFPHCLVSIPNGVGTRIEILTIAPTRYSRESLGSPEAATLMPRLRIFSATVDSETDLYGVKCWVAKGRTKEGESIEAYFEQESGLLIWQVTETPEYRAIRTVWHVQ